MALAIAFMYFFDLVLIVPFAFALYCAFSGDRMRAMQQEEVMAKAGDANQPPAGPNLALTA